MENQPDKEVSGLRVSGQGFGFWSLRFGVLEVRVLELGVYGF